ncbi:cytochrome P450 [Salinithrix halophila]|uniref:Cytochrome P450 n=1 Tax=Salinithrix halophila TaxID=1485204 RepID=A0ABV8JFJ5_9BACL
MSVKDPIFIEEVTGLKTKREKFDPYSWYQEMRERNPVYYDPKQQVWNVFLYDDVNRVLSDYHLFTSQKSRVPSGFPRISSASERVRMNEMDPPQQVKIRSLVSKAFTPRALRDWEPRIQTVTEFLLDQLDEQGPMDILEDLAIPLPVTVISDLLGIPSADWKRFKNWSDILFTPGSRETYADLEEKKAQARRELGEYLYPVVQEKRENPQNDIISSLTQAEFEGDKLSDLEIIHFTIGLLAAGNETTTTLIANAFYCFLRDTPGIYQQLRANPEWIPKAIEEVLRYRSPAQIMTRRVKKDTDVFGPVFKEGEHVIAWIGSANWDKKQFSHPEQFDIHRSNNQTHLSFGKGAHFCLGAPLSRLEAKIALTEFVRRYPEISLPRGWELEDCLEEGFNRLSRFPIITAKI